MYVEMDCCTDSELFAYNNTVPAILYTLRFGTEVTTRTTIGYNVESIVYKNTEFTVIVSNA